ncbi:acetyltransferase [Sphingomonas sp. PB2P19]|uniref:acetyltransferase n=1 Tax=Sphingomonas rhamnosi TaxID=3096156 RepID=UPI002FC743C1
MPDRETKKPLYVLGAGGFALQMLDTLDQLAAQGRSIVIADDAAIAEMAGYPVVDVADVPSQGRAVIAISRPQTRRLVAGRRDDLVWDRLVADTAIVSRAAAMGPGAILAHGVIIEANCRIGRHFHANLHSYVAHECIVGDFVTMSPRVSCNGNVHIGDNVFIGTGAMIRQGQPDAPLVIGEGAFIGMGAIVTRNVPPGTVVKAVAAI